MVEVRLLVEWMADRGVGLTELIAASGLDDGVVAAIAQGRYTPSPQQRQRLATALGIEPEQVAWGHIVPVEHVYGHGPQFGRSP
jgi:hypothetical protein